MNSDPNGYRYRVKNLLRTRNWARLATIGVCAAGVTSLFAYAGGFFSPGSLTPRSMINTFQFANGVYPGFRRNHAKGVCITGYFDSNGNGQKLSKAVVFKPGRTPVEGRFAVAVGAPDVPDSNREVRSMALRFKSSNGEEWRTGMNDIPVFAVNSAVAFRDQLLAMKKDPATGQPDPAKVSAFLDRYPASARAVATINRTAFSSGFDNASYNSLNAFKFVTDSGAVNLVRWSMAATSPFFAEQGNAPNDQNYLFDDVIKKIQAGPLQWHLILNVGQPGDSANDATIAWPDDREKVDAGTLTIVAVQAEELGNCRDINFDPLVLPDGIRPSDDPLLSARSAAYAVSFRRRAGENHTPSAVQIDSKAVQIDSKKEGM